jgi:hypothetical protein
MAEENAQKVLRIYRLVLLAAWAGWLLGCWLAGLGGLAGLAGWVLAGWSGCWLAAGYLGWLADWAGRPGAEAIRQSDGPTFLSELMGSPTFRDTAVNQQLVGILICLRLRTSRVLG